MRKDNLIVYSLYFLVIALLLLGVVIQNRYSTEGAEYDRLLSQLKSAKREQLLIQEQLLDAESLGTIESKARATGFVPAKFVYLP